MPFVIECSDVPPVIFSDETTEYRWLLDGYPAAANSAHRFLKGRLTLRATPAGLVNGSNHVFTFVREPVTVYRNGVDETDLGTIDADALTFTFDTPPATDDSIVGYVLIDILTYQLDEDDQNDGVFTLQVTLADPDDKDLITRDASIRFETGEKISSVWQWQTWLDTAKIRSSEYTLANQSLSPADKVAMTFMSVLQSRLDTSPLNQVVLYDPDKLTVVESDFLNVPDIDGVGHLVTIIAIHGLDLEQILSYMVSVCGFTGHPGYVTNIPNFQIPRIDFQPGEPYWNPIAGEIGIFKPQIEIDADDNFVVREGMNDLLPDTSAARILTVDDVTNLGLSKDIERFKGVLLTYQEKGLGYDYFVDTIVHKDRFRNNVAGRDPFIRQETYLRRFYRRSLPNTPVNTLRIRDNKWVEITALGNVIIAASSEVLTYNQFNLIATKEKRIHSRQKAPQSWVNFSGTLPTAGFDASFEGAEVGFTSDSDDVFETALVLVKTQRELSEYLAHPFQAEAVYLANREAETRGLITRDTDNQQLGQDFDQPLLQAQRAGNLAEGQGSYWGTVGENDEKQEPGPNREVNITTTETDSLNVDEGEALLPADYEDPRRGDIGISTVQVIPKRTYVFDEGDATATKILHLNGGNAPLSILKPLCVRYNRAQFFPGNIQTTVPGIDRSLARGRAIDPRVDGRENVSLGTYRITGRTMSGDNGGRFHRTVLKARQIGSDDVPAVSSVLNDSFSGAFEPSEQRTYSILVPCFVGTQISGNVVADFVVEARHGTGGSWTNIETDAIPLDAWDGTTQTFQVRVTAPSVITTPIVRVFVLTRGPVINVNRMLYLGDRMTYGGDPMIYTN